MFNTRTHHKRVNCRTSSGLSPAPSCWDSEPLHLLGLTSKPSSRLTPKCSWGSKPRLLLSKSCLLATETLSTKPCCGICLCTSISRRRRHSTETSILHSKLSKSTLTVGRSGTTKLSEPRIWHRGPCGSPKLSKTSLLRCTKWICTHGIWGTTHSWCRLWSQWCITAATEWVSCWKYTKKFIVEDLYMYHLSHVMKKPVFAIWEQQRRRSACTFAQSDQHLCYLLPR